MEKAIAVDVVEGRRDLLDDVADLLVVRTDDGDAGGGDGTAGYAGNGDGDDCGDDCVADGGYGDDEEMMKTMVMMMMSMTMQVMKMLMTMMVMI